MATVPVAARGRAFSWRHRFNTVEHGALAPASVRTPSGPKKFLYVAFSFPSQAGALDPWKMARGLLGYGWKAIALTGLGDACPAVLRDPAIGPNGTITDYLLLVLGIAAVGAASIVFFYLPWRKRILIALDSNW